MNETQTPYAIPLFVGAVWLTITTVCVILSGWFPLMKAFPDRSEDPLLKITLPSGTMGPGISVKGLVTLSVCPSGLRLGMSRVFGPLCRPVFVPWEALRVVRTDGVFGPLAELRFGQEAVGLLRIPAYVAEWLAAAAGARWPETSVPAPETRL